MSWSAPLVRSSVFAVDQRGRQSWLVRDNCRSGDFESLGGIGVLWMVVATIKADDCTGDCFLFQTLREGRQMTMWNGDGECTVVSNAGDVCLS